ncbi:MAG: serine/threonine protein kinase [Planctomycetes bacterium]|nr:serine/threonine protein kinase [Planctomycetota bacterium]
MSALENPSKDDGWQTENPSTSDSTLKMDFKTGSLVGRKIGPFRVLSEIGRGGMGVVYKAQDETLDRVVALKVLAARLEEGDEFRERFLREARSAAGLDHPSIVPVYSAGDDAGHLYIAMQFIQGETLAALTRRKGHLSVRRSLEITRDAALALGEAHRRGFVHRDIKSPNLMIDLQGRVKVMDFGLSRAMRPGGQITQTGTYLGTPQYSSPEQCETQDLDGRTDLYSLGVCLYEMLTGRLPHAAETPISLFRKIVEEKPLAVAQVNPNCPRTVSQFVERMMAKKRSDRPPSAEACVDELQAILAKETLPATEVDELPLSSSPPTAVHSAPAQRRRFVLPLAAGTAVAALAALALFQVLAPSVPPGPSHGDGRNSTSHPGPVTDGGNAGTPPRTTPATDPNHPAPGETCTVAMVDFLNVSHNPEVEWLGVGIPEMLLSALGGDPDFQVVPRDVLLGDLARTQVNKQQVLKECANPSEYAAADPGADARLAFSPALEAVLAARQVRLLIAGGFVAPKEAKVLEVFADVIARNADGTKQRLPRVKARGDRSAIFDVVDALADQLVAQLEGGKDEATGGNAVAAHGDKNLESGHARVGSSRAWLDARRQVAQAQARAQSSLAAEGTFGAASEEAKSGRLSPKTARESERSATAALRPSYLVRKQERGRAGAGAAPATAGAMPAPGADKSSRAGASGRGAGKAAPAGEAEPSRAKADAGDRGAAGTANAPTAKKEGKPGEAGEEMRRGLRSAPEEQLAAGGGAADGAGSDLAAAAGSDMAAAAGRDMAAAAAPGAEAPRQESRDLDEKAKERGLETEALPPAGKPADSEAEAGAPAGGGKGGPAEPDATPTASEAAGPAAASGSSSTVPAPPSGPPASPPAPGGAGAAGAVSKPPQPLARRLADDSKSEAGRPVLSEEERRGQLWCRIRQVLEGDRPLAPASRAELAELEVAVWDEELELEPMTRRVSEIEQEPFGNQGK